MRAMILAAGLGTRLRPLTLLRPKPALPVRGLPVIAYSLALLHRHGVSQVAINLHHKGELLRAVSQDAAPRGMQLSFSEEPEPLGTGGGIRQLAGFLGESDPCLILAGDMILDTDLDALVRDHRDHRRAVTLLLREDSRGEEFGTIGIDRHGRVRRIASRFDLGGEHEAGVYAHATVVSAAALDSLPADKVFGHLDDWLMPLLADGADDIGALLVSEADCGWEPVGTPQEYLAANLYPPKLSFLDADEEAKRRGTRFEGDLVIGAGAELGEGVRLRRTVVWDGERVPQGFEGADGVFAGGEFHSCAERGRRTQNG